MNEDIDERTEAFYERMHQKITEDEIVEKFKRSIRTSKKRMNDNVDKNQKSSVD